MSPDREKLRNATFSSQSKNAHSCFVRNERTGALRPTERVYFQIRRDLLSSRFELGKRLFINDLADRYHVSNTPVREALSRLRAEELIGFIPGHGYYFRVPNLDEIQDIYQLISILISSSLRDISPEREGSVKWGSIEEFGEQALQATAEALVKRIEFIYKGTIDISGNKVSYRVIENILARTHFVRRAALELDGRLEEFRRLVGQIGFALETRNFQSALQCIQECIEREKRLAPRALRDLIAGPFLCQLESQ